MDLLAAVKLRLGIFYDDPKKDAEVSQMIRGAVQYFKGAGWNISPTPTTADDLGVEAVQLWCKMAQSTDPAQLTNHPVLLSMIAQGRATV